MTSWEVSTPGYGYTPLYPHGWTAWLYPALVIWLRPRDHIGFTRYEDALGTWLPWFTLWKEWD
jgi:hypothetical protein